MAKFPDLAQLVEFRKNSTKSPFLPLESCEIVHAMTNISIILVEFCAPLIIHFMATISILFSSEHILMWVYVKSRHPFSSMLLHTLNEYMATNIGISVFP